MCPPKIPKTATAMPKAPDLPDKGPDEVVVKKDKSARRRGNPLRIDLATNAQGTTGVNV